MFRLVAVPTMSRTVTVRVPVEGAVDKTEAQTFKALFRVLTREEQIAFDAARRTLSTEELTANPHAFLKRVVAGWEDVLDDNGENVPFSTGALERALDLPWVAAALYDAYRAGLAGEPRLGN